MMDYLYAPSEVFYRLEIKKKGLLWIADFYRFLQHVLVGKLELIFEEVFISFHNKYPKHPMYFYHDF